MFVDASRVRSPRIDLLIRSCFAKPPLALEPLFLDVALNPTNVLQRNLTELLGLRVVDLQLGVPGQEDLPDVKRAVRKFEDTWQPIRTCNGSRAEGVDCWRLVRDRKAAKSGRKGQHHGCLESSRTVERSLGSKPGINTVLHNSTFLSSLAMAAARSTRSSIDILAGNAHREMFTYRVDFICKMSRVGFGEGSESAIMGAGPAGEYRLGFERVPGLAAEWERRASPACSSRLGTRQISGGPCHGHGK